MVSLGVQIADIRLSVTALSFSGERPDTGVLDLVFANASQKRRHS